MKRLFQIAALAALLGSPLCLPACSSGSGPLGSDLDLGTEPEAEVAEPDGVPEPDGDVGSEPEVEPEVPLDVEPDAEPDALIADVADGVEPDVEPEVLPDVEPVDVLDGVDAGVEPDVPIEPEAPPPFEGWSALHDVGSLPAVDDFLSACWTGGVPWECKFVLAHFSTPEEAQGAKDFLMDPAFYKLHDEWYWFRLLSGVPIDGLEVEPIVGPSYESIEAVYEAFADVPSGELPLAMKWTSAGRLYAPEFYELGLWEEPRFFGLGSLLYHPPNPKRAKPEALWLFELEFVDYQVTEEQIGTFFGRLEATLPPELAGQLQWLVRSTPQEALGASMEAGGGPYADRIVTYADLVIEGNVEAYNPGITAGYIELVQAGSVGATSVGPKHIAVLAEVPDELPPVAGIVTAVPQTPLAHLNLLATSRGTPNVHIAGILEDAGVAEWANWSKPVILHVWEHGVAFKQLTSLQYKHYLELLGVGELEVPVADLQDAPYVIPLDGGLAEAPGLVPLCGGKAASIQAFQSFEGQAADIPAPATPLCITVRAFDEHESLFDAVLDALLANADFLADPRARFVVLEGHEDYLLAHADDPEALLWWDEWQLDHPPSEFLGSIVAGGGFKALMREVPIAPGTLALLTEAVEARFAALSDLQGLRFRSSSTAEDAVGFNGAGLYDSNTGFLEPMLQPKSKDKKKSLEWALKKTWASYWSFGAYEERTAAGIDHRDGRMGVLVHPRFDDPKELANGVLTLFYAAPEAAGSGPKAARLVVNVQAGAISVTNPTPGSGALPEVDEVNPKPGGGLEILRLQPSTEVEPGALVLDDAQLTWLHSVLTPLAAAWVDQSNEGIPAAQHRSTVVLDMEFKDMAEGWPALASGALEPERLVLKQVRTLDRAVRIPDELALEPIPLDVQEHAFEAHRRSCLAGPLEIELLEIYTDEAAAWGLGYGAAPFVAWVSLGLTEAVEELGAGPTGPMTLPWTLLSDQGHPAMEASGGEGWDLSLVLDPAVAAVLGFTAITLVAGDEEGGGTWALSAGSEGAAGAGCLCTVEDLMDSPAEYLHGILDAE